MSNFLKRFSKNIGEEIDYKTLYETELNNRKMYEDRYRHIEKEYQQLQKDKGIGELRKKIIELNNTIVVLNEKLNFVTEDRAKLFTQLEDLENEMGVKKRRGRPPRKKETIIEEEKKEEKSKITKKRGRRVKNENNRTSVNR